MAADPQTTPGPGPSSAGRPGGRENVFTRKLGPLPMWVWLAIVAGLVLLWVVWSSRKSSAGAPASSGPATGSALVPPVVVHGARGPRGRRGRPGGDDDDDGKRRRPRPHPGRRRKGHGGGGPGGPARHHKDRDDDDRDRDRDDRDREEHKHPRRPATRGVPGAGPVTGALVSFTVPQTGPAPSLSQVASQYNTSPDAIVEEATGRGSPHGALWRRYVGAHDWDEPLPHGTDMTVLAQPD